MRLLALIAALCAPGAAFAQTNGVAAAEASGEAAGDRVVAPLTKSDSVAAFAIKPPDEGSPFFTLRQEAKFVASQQGQQRLQADSLAVYPRAKNSPDSASSMFTKFFTEMFASVKFKTLRAERTTQTLKIEPEDFSLAERRELDATYVIRNNTGKIIRLDYTTGQRIEMLTKDPSGKVVEKWSDDRAFSPQEGVVIINPKERIEYQEKVPTREMKAGETYTIESEVIGYPDYTKTETVTPAP